MGNDRTTITKLATNGLNWVTYHNRMISAFYCRRWLEHLSTTTVPQSYLDAGDINGMSPQARWASEERTAKEMIAESVPDHVFNRIKTKTTTMELWDALKGLCQSRFKLIIIDLNKRVQNAKCGEDDDIRAHINKLDDMREQLSAMGKVIDDQEYASILLGSLPTSYAPTISLINTMAVMTGLDITPDRVARLATNEFDQRMIAAGKFNNGPDEAFATEDQKKDRSNFECYNCHKKGHVKSKCCAKGGGKEGQRPPRNNNRMSKSNRNNRKSNVNQNNDNANSANADTEAWAAIEEIEETEAAVEGIDETDHSDIQQIVYSAGY